MKATLKDGTVIEGTYDEIKSLMGKQANRDQHVVKKEVFVSKLETSMRSIKTPSFAAAFKHLANDGKIKTMAKKLGMKTISIKGGAKDHIAYLPISQPETKKQIAIPEATQTVYRKGKMGSRTETIKTILERDGYITAKKISQYGGFQSLNKTVKGLGIRGVEAFVEKFRGIYTEGHREDLLSAFSRQHHVKLHKTKGYVMNEYNEYLKLRVGQLSKQGIYAPEAFKIISVEWSKKKAEKNSVGITANTFKDVPQHFSKTSVYNSILKELFAKGVLHYSAYSLDMIGQHLRESGKVTWQFRDMYMSETDWNDKLLPLFLMHLTQLKNIWELRSLTVSNGELIGETERVTITPEVKQ